MWNIKVRGDDRGHSKKSLENQLESFGSKDNLFFRRQNYLGKHNNIVSLLCLRSFSNFLFLLGENQNSLIWPTGPVVVCSLTTAPASAGAVCFCILHLSPLLCLDLGMQNPRPSYNSFLLESFSSNSICQVLCYLSGPNLNGRILISS